MDIITWDNSHKQRKYIKEILLAGGVIVYPTETAYGLGADPRSKKGVDLIYNIKQRPRNKALPLIASSLYQAKKCVQLNKHELAYVKKHWPGPYTVVLDKRKGVTLPHLASDSWAVRVSGGYIARTIARMIKHPLVSTSANLSGQETCYDIQCVISQFENKKYKPGIIIDGGRLKRRKPSSIVRFEDDKKIIIRP